MSVCTPLERRVPHWKTLAVAQVCSNAATAKPRTLIATFSPIIHLFKLALSAKLWAKYTEDMYTFILLLPICYSILHGVELKQLAVRLISACGTDKLTASSHFVKCFRR